MSNNIVFAWTRMSGKDDNGNINEFYGMNDYPMYFVMYSGFATDTVTAFHNACTSWNNADVGNLVFRSTAQTHNYMPTSSIGWAIKGDGNKVTKGDFGNIG